LKKLGGGRFRDPGFFLPAGFSLHEGGLGVICTYGDCGGNGKLADREGRSIKAISGDLRLGGVSVLRVKLLAF
jgi:hypothetical protein